MIKRGAEDVRLAMLVKQRIKASEIARMDLVGDVRNCDVVRVFQFDRFTVTSMITL